MLDFFVSLHKITTFVVKLKFPRYNASIHCLVYGHMTSYNRTVSRQKPMASNTASQCFPRFRPGTSH